MRDKKLILGQTKDFYDKMAKVCSENAFDLMCDANHLVFGKAYVRAFGVGVICAEEYSKAILFKAASLGMVRLEDVISKDGRIFLPFDHIGKQKAIRDFIALSLAILQDDQLKKFTEAAILNKPIPDLVVNEQKRQKILDIFENIEDWKQDSFYVGFDGKKIIVPKKAVTEKRCLELLDTLLEGLSSINNFVRTDSRLLRLIIAQLPIGKH